MCSEEVQNKVDKITKDIEKQDGIVSVIVDRMDNEDWVESNKLGATGEWKTFEKTACLKRFVDEEITLLDLRLKRMEIKADSLLDE